MLLSVVNIAICELRVHPVHLVNCRIGAGIGPTSKVPWAYTSISPNCASRLVKPLCTACKRAQHRPRRVSRVGKGRMRVDDATHKRKRARQINTRNNGSLYLSLRPNVRLQSETKSSALDPINMQKCKVTINFGLKIFHISLVCNVV